jgi:hypothetical protein
MVSYCPSAAKFGVGPTPPKVSMFGHMAKEEACCSLSVMRVLLVAIVPLGRSQLLCLVR